MATLFTPLVVARDLFAGRRVAWHPGWYALFALGVVAYVVLRTARKHTRLLQE